MPEAFTSTQTAPSPSLPPGKTGWFKESSALLLFDASGSLSAEIGLGLWEFPTDSGIDVHEIRGGASASRRFAWVFDRVTGWNASRTRIIASRRSLRLLGSTGRDLWTSPGADKPERGEPLVFSGDGEALIACSRSAQGWTAEVKNFLGATLLEVGPMPRLELMEMTPNGRYALVRWTDPDKSATHTLLDVTAKSRKDIPSSEFYLGAARLGDDGKVFSGRRLVHDFASAPQVESSQKP